MSNEANFWNALERANNRLQEARNHPDTLTVARDAEAAGRRAYDIATSYAQRNAAVRVINDASELIDMNKGE